MNRMIIIQLQYHSLSSIKITGVKLIYLFKLILIIEQKKEVACHVGVKYLQVILDLL